MTIGKWFAACTCWAMLVYPSRCPAAEPAPAAVEQPASDSAKASPAATVDVSFIPADATIAIIIHPQPLLTGPNAEWMPVEVITAAGIQQLGIDPIQVREALMCVVPPSAKTPQAEPGMGTVVRFSKPYDKAAFLAKLGGKEQTTADGTTFYQLGGPDKFCVTLPNAETIVFGTRATVLEMLTAKDVDSPLVKLLRNSDCSATYTVLASLDAMRDLITEALVKIPQLPPPLDQFRKAPMLISSAKMQADFASGVDFSITLHAVDDEAAGELLDLLNNALALGKQVMLGQMQHEMRRECRRSRATGNGEIRQPHRHPHVRLGEAGPHRAKCQDRVALRWRRGHGRHHGGAVAPGRASRARRRTATSRWARSSNSDWRY